MTPTEQQAFDAMREAFGDVMFHLEEAIKNGVQPYEVEEAFKRAEPALAATRTLPTDAGYLRLYQ